MESYRLLGKEGAIGFHNAGMSCEFAIKEAKSGNF
jgi:hypothetical protein